MSNKYVDLDTEILYGNPIVYSVFWQSLFQANRNIMVNPLYEDFLFFCYVGAIQMM